MKSASAVSRPMAVCAFTMALLLLYFAGAYVLNVCLCVRACICEPATERTWCDNMFACSLLIRLSLLFCVYGNREISSTILWGSIPTDGFWTSVVVGLYSVFCIPFFNGSRCAHVECRCQGFIALRYFNEFACVIYSAEIYLKKKGEANAL